MNRHTFAGRLNRAAVVLAAIVATAGAPAPAGAQAIIGRLVASGDADALGGNYGIVRNAGFPTSSKATIEATSIGIFVHNGTTLTAIARSGGPAAGGGSYASIGFPSSNAGGDIVFSSTLNNGLASQALFLYDGGTSTTAILAKAGDAAPGGGTFTRFDQKPAINVNGDVAFAATTTIGKGLFFRPAAGPATAIVLSGDPGVCGAGTFASFSVGNKKGPAVNDSGDIAFWASETGGGQEGMYVYSASGPSLTAAACKGDTTITGGEYRNIGQQPAINNGGEVVFEAAVDPGPGPNHDSLFLANATCSPTACLIAETTGTGSGITGTFQQIAADVVPVITDAGDVIFDAKITGPADDAIFSWNETSGTFARLVGTGDSCDTGGTIQVIQSQQTYNGTSLAFRARCTNGNAILRKDGASPSTLLIQVPTVTSVGAGFTSQMPSLDGATGVVFRSTRTSLQNSMLFPPVIISTLLAPGTAVPGVPGAIIESYWEGSASSGSNRVAFIAQTAGVGINEGIFLARSSSNPQLQTVAMGGDPSPVGGLSFYSFSFPGSLLEQPLRGPRPAPVTGDKVAFVALLDDSSLGIFRGEAGELTTVAHTGDPAPDGGTYLQLSAPTTDRNKIAFAATTDLNTCVFYARNDNVALEAQACVGDAVPAPVGGTIGEILSLPIIGSSRRVSFRAAIVGGSSSECLLRAREVQGTPTLQVLGCVGDTAPGGGTFLAFEDDLLGGMPAGHGNDVVSFASVGGTNGVYKFEGGNTITVTKILAIGDALLPPLSGVATEAGGGGWLSVRGSYSLLDLSLSGGTSSNAVGLALSF